MTIAFTIISAFAAFAIAWSTIAFHGWVRAQRQPKPVFLDGRLVLDTTFPGFRTSLNFSNPGDVPIFVKSVRVELRGPLGGVPGFSLDGMKQCEPGERTIKPRDEISIKVNINTSGKVQGEDIASFKPGSLKLVIACASGSHNYVLCPDLELQGGDDRSWAILPSPRKCRWWGWWKKATAASG